LSAKKVKIKINPELGAQNGFVLRLTG